jgi:branched-chain amino acid transport system permease protein
MFTSELLIQTFIAGLMIGALYALMALGITFIYSIVKAINWAMGEFHMIGSCFEYVAVTFALSPRYWWLAALSAASGTFVLGYTLEPILIKPMYTTAMEQRDD